MKKKLRKKKFCITQIYRQIVMTSLKLLWTRMPTKLPKKSDKLDDSEDDSISLAPVTQEEVGKQLVQ
eukprot:14507344-Ditylum_brightwellii.AAC.1